MPPVSGPACRARRHYSRPMVAADLTPRGPYSLALSARGASDATRTWRDGILDAELPSGRAVAWQHPDGRVTVRATTEERVRGDALLPRDRRRPHAVRAPLPARPVPRHRDPAAARAAPGSARHRRPGAPSRAVRPADPGERGARDGAADHPRDDRGTARVAPRAADRLRPRPALARPAPQARPARAPRRDPRPPLRAGSSSGSRSSRPPSSPIA